MFESEIWQMHMEHDSPKPVCRGCLEAMTSDEFRDCRIDLCQILRELRDRWHNWKASDSTGSHRSPLWQAAALAESPWSSFKRTTWSCFFTVLTSFGDCVGESGRMVSLCFLAIVQGLLPGISGESQSEADHAHQRCKPWHKDGQVVNHEKDTGFLCGIFESRKRCEGY